MWANLLLPNALKSCPKSLKSPILDTLTAGLQFNSDLIGPNKKICCYVLNPD